MNPNQWTPENCQLDAESLAKNLQCPEFIRSLPFLNHSKLEKINDMTLVRFRGMIQDMCDPEIYLETYEVKADDGTSRLQNGRFRDTILVNDNETFLPESAQNKHGERRTMFLITVPGLNAWAEEAEKSQFGAEPNAVQSPEAAKGVKRHLEDEDPMETDLPEGDAHVTKKVHGAHEAQPEGKLMLSPEYLVNSPIADRPGRACLVKIYDNFDTFKLNHVVDIVGFLSVDPALDGTMYEPNEFEDQTEQQSKNPPPSLIPRLHAIKISPVASLNPLLELHHPIVESAEALRKDVETALIHSLFGDKLAANLILCHLVSSVYVRNEMNCLGQFSLNLSHLPVAVSPDYTKQLYEMIEMLMPASHYLPMTLENMNTLQFSPKKDYQTNKLTSGLLQLAPHTHLVLDETKLQPGKLEAGVNAVANIAHMIKNQKLKYNFQFYQLDFDTDIPILVVSEGKSMLPHDCHIPLMPDQETIPLIGETIAATKHFLQPKLQQIRTFLTKARIGPFEMSTSDPDMIQNDIIEIRRETNATVEELHQLMVMGRLVGLTYGKARMDREAWDVAKEMHKEIKSRHELVNKNRNEI